MTPDAQLEDTNGGANEQLKMLGVFAGLAALFLALLSMFIVSVVVGIWMVWTIFAHPEGLSAGMVAFGDALRLHTRGFIYLFIELGLSVVLGYLDFITTVSDAGVTYEEAGVLAIFINFPVGLVMFAPLLAAGVVLVKVKQVLAVVFRRLNDLIEWLDEIEECDTA